MRQKSIVSVITSTYNKAQYLDLTLTGFLNQTYRNFEMIIVDDGSTDDTAKIVEQYAKKIDIKYYFQENQGIAKARNKALDLAKGDYIIIVDDDRIPCPDFIYEHKRILDQHKKCVSIGKEVMIVSIFDPQITFDFNFGIRFMDKHPELLNKGIVHLINKDDLCTDFNMAIEKCYLSDTLNSSQLEKCGEALDEYILAWSKAYGGNIAFNRNFCDEIPKYDTGYVGYGMEDIDLSYQLYLQGFSYRYNKAAVNYHQEHKRGKNEFQSLYKNLLYFYNKYQDLETLLLKLDWGAEVSYEEVTAFGKIMSTYYSVLQEPIEKYCIQKKKCREGIK